VGSGRVGPKFALEIGKEFRPSGRGCRKKGTLSSHKIGNSPGGVHVGGRQEHARLPSVEQGAHHGGTERGMQLGDQGWGKVRKGPEPKGRGEASGSLKKAWVEKGKLIKRGGKERGSAKW